MQALGLIEVNGYLAGISAADTALKAANVTLLFSERIRGGLSTILLIGDVAAIQAAVDAGSKEAERLGQLLSSHVIPRLDEQTKKILKKSAENSQTKKPLSREDASNLSKKIKAEMASGGKKESLTQATDEEKESSQVKKSSNAKEKQLSKSDKNTKTDEKNLPVPTPKKEEKQSKKAAENSKTKKTSEAKKKSGTNQKKK